MSSSFVGGTADCALPYPVVSKIAHHATPTGVVWFVLGAAQVPPSPPLPGPVLVRMLGDLGMAEGAARSTILRMRRAGSITSVRVDRTAGYAPSPSAPAGHRRHAAGSAAAAWDGEFHTLLVQVPERRRGFRDALRRAAHIAGYRGLGPGLLVAPTDRRAELAPTLERVPKDALILPGHLRLTIEDSRTVAMRLWELDELGARYRVLADTAHAAAARARADPPAGPDALRALAAATLPIYEAIRDDPELPMQLLAPDWPQHRLRVALTECLHALVPRVAEYVAALRAGT
jgi:phenylacetic acid degradation operon negative regulatory protein